MLGFTLGIGNLNPLLGGTGTDNAAPLYQFNYNAAPFGFGVSRVGVTDAEPLFSTRGSRLMFKVITRVATASCLA